MAIKTFKDIEQKKGYRVDKKDREIFEREVRRGIFGMDSGDIIEFVLYDSADNPLPQESANGKLVRYISYTDTNIQKYFSKVNQTKFNIKRNGAEEFFIDVEKLIKEAGYSQGVFKTSVSLLNRRLGSEDRKFDKVWIHEISPSRTEVRVLTVIDESTGKPNSDLQTRYNTLVRGEDFAADVVLFLDEFSQQFDVQKVLERMLRLRGKVADGQGYIKLIQKEFKIENFERWLSLVKISFDKSLDNFKNKRYYNILEQDKFGKPTGESFGVNFDSRGIIQQLCDIAENCVNYHLPSQDIRRETARSRTQQKTLDKVKQILKTVESDGEFLAEKPTEKKPAVRGCRDPKATNYNAAATVDDICNYTVNITKYRKMCNDKNALNYNTAETCKYPPPPPPPPPPAPAWNPPRPTGGSTGASSGGSSLCKYGSRYSISGPPDKSFTKSGGKGNKGISVLIDGGRVMPVCRIRVGFQLSGVPSWITPNLLSKSNDSASNFSYTVAANSGSARSATITITPNAAAAGGRSYSFTVTQAGSGPTPPAPTYPKRGTIIKDICEGTTRKIGYADGKGGLQSPPTLEKNSPKCGYTAPKTTPPKAIPVAGAASGCLVGNTMIEMADGQMNQIKNIKIGDTLMGLDITTLSGNYTVEDNWRGKNIQQYKNKSFQVTDTHVISDAEVYSVNGGLLECSEDHKHMVRRGEEWMIRTTLQLQPGDIMIDRDMNEILINNISWDRTEDVYLITLNGKHTYYANGILTHNRKPIEKEIIQDGVNYSSRSYSGQGSGETRSVSRGNQR